MGRIQAAAQSLVHKLSLDQSRHPALVVWTVETLRRLRFTNIKWNFQSSKNHSIVDKAIQRMKLSLATLSLIEAAKNGKGGKHGNVDLGDNERFNWKTPKCIQNNDLFCSSETVKTEEGSITFDESNYKNFEVSLNYFNVYF